MAQEKRQRKNDDVQKRREFRIAHGLEEDLPTPALPGTTVAGGVGKAANEEIMALVQAKELKRKGRAVDGGDSEGSSGNVKVYKDFDGNTHLAKKRWYEFWS